MFARLSRPPLLLLICVPVAGAQGIKLNGPMPTSPEGDAFGCAFDASGERVFYFAEQREAAELFAVPADRSSRPVRIDAGAGTVVPTPDGTRMVYRVLLDGVRNLRSVPVDGSAPPVTLHGPLASTVTLEFAVSPDSQWVVYRAGTQLFSTNADGGGPAIPLASGVTQHWITGDSEHAVFLGTGAGMFSVPIDGSSAPLRIDLGGFLHGNVAQPQDHRGRQHGRLHGQHGRRHACLRGTGRRQHDAELAER
jgi:hypothetical protein